MIKPRILVTGASTASAAWLSPAHRGDTRPIPPSPEIRLQILLQQQHAPAIQESRAWHEFLGQRNNAILAALPFDRER